MTRSARAVRRELQRPIVPLHLHAQGVGHVGSDSDRESPGGRGGNGESGLDERNSDMVGDATWRHLRVAGD